MGKPSPADRPSGTEVARFLTRKLLLIILLLFVASYLVYSHSSAITSEIDDLKAYVPNVHIPTSLGQSAAQQDTTTNSNTLGQPKPGNKPPSEFHPHSHENFLYLDAAKEFWAPWAKAIMRSKPSMEEIRLQGSANNVPVEGDRARSERMPARDYVDLSSEDMSRLRDSHQEFRDLLDSYNPRSDLEAMYHHRGMVTVGGGEFMGPAIVSIQMLRATGSDLPVEVFVANWEEYEAELCEEYLPSKLNARCLIIEEFLIEAVNHDLRKQVGHYGLKVMALLFSTFRNAILIDSDSIPLVDPAQLFESTAFVETGFLSWPDFWAGSESPRFYEIAGLRDFPHGLAPTSSEAGQIVIDKQRHLKTLLLATYYNVWGPKHFYPLLSQGALGQGDKNTFESAAIVLNATYYRVPKPVDDVGRYTKPNEQGFKGSGMVQFMPETDIDTNRINDVSRAPQSNTPAFVHANTPKMNAGHLVDEGDLKGVDGKKLRLWGSKEEQEEMFGRDLEKEVWQVVKDTGCELAHTVKEWKNRKDMCDRLNKHWSEVFA